MCLRTIRGFGHHIITKIAPVIWSCGLAKFDGRSYRLPFPHNTTCTVSNMIMMSRNSVWFLT